MSTGQPTAEGRILNPLINRLFHLRWRMTRGLTLGVRVIALDAQGRVYLVRHGYIPGWHLPGGGVEPGETALTALEREMMEEGRLIFGEPPRLHGVFFNRHVSNRDHVLVYVARAVTQTGVRLPDAEIREGGFHAPDALPEQTTRATRARIAEVQTGAAPDPIW